MSNDLTIVVEDVNTIMVTYDVIQIDRASSADGSFSNITSLTLVEDDIEYDYTDTGGAITDWYRYRFYNTGTLAFSLWSNPFNVGGYTRKRLRAYAILEYNAGITLLAAAGSTPTVIALSNYNVSSSLFSTQRGAGTWLMPSSGSQTEEISRVTALDPDASPAEFTVSPALSGSIQEDDEVEWHWLASPDVWNLCINRALRRYVYVERVPIVGEGSIEINLSYLPWLRKRRQVAGLWYTPLDGYEELPYGNWWNTREDAGKVYLSTRPQLETTDTVYLEAFRTADEVFTDTSVFAEDINEELLAAMAYEEVLKFIIRPGTSVASTDRTIWERELDQHRRSTLSRLAKRERPRVRYQRPPTPQTTRTPTFWRAR